MGGQKPQNTKMMGQASHDMTSKLQQIDKPHLNAKPLLAPSLSSKVRSSHFFTLPSPVPSNNRVQQLAVKGDSMICQKRN